MDDFFFRQSPVTPVPQPSASLHGPVAAVSARAASRLQAQRKDSRPSDKRRFERTQRRQPTAASNDLPRGVSGASAQTLLFNAHRSRRIHLHVRVATKADGSEKSRTQSASFPYAIIMMHLARPRCGPPSRSPGRLLRSGPRAAPLTPLAGSHPNHQRRGMVSNGAFMRSAHLGTYDTSRPDGNRARRG